MGLKQRLTHAFGRRPVTVSAPPPPPPARNYEVLYETQAAADVADEAVGNGSYDGIGRLELDLLRMEGLKPTQTLVDFGCGNGRLAVHAIPYLVGGDYVGIDISESFLARAKVRVGARVPQPPCSVTWQKQTSETFALAEASVDMMCAFSVFTHMEHEDNYRYLKAIRPLIRPGGKFVFSCLPMCTEAARDIFLLQAALDLPTRWEAVRNVTTTIEYMNEVAKLAGWKVVRWYRGDEKNIGPAGGPLEAFGQSSCVLVPAGE